MSKDWVCLIEGAFVRWSVIRPVNVDLPGLALHEHQERINVKQDHMCLCEFIIQLSRPAIF